MRPPSMSFCLAVAALAGSSGISAGARAAEPGAAGAIAQSVAIRPAGVRAAGGTANAMPRPIPGIGQALDNDALDELRGGDSAVVRVEVHNGGRVDGNTADDVVSGWNVIHSGAFANGSGISTVIQNSGSNVLIQNGTAVNVQFVDPGL